MSLPDLHAMLYEGDVIYCCCYVQCSLMCIVHCELSIMLVVLRGSVFMPLGVDFSPLAIN